MVSPLDKLIWTPLELAHGLPRSIDAHNADPRSLDIHTADIFTVRELTPNALRLGLGDGSTKDVKMALSELELGIAPHTITMQTNTSIAPTASHVSSNDDGPRPTNDTVQLMLRSLQGGTINTGTMCYFNSVMPCFKLAISCPKPAQ